MSIEYFFKLSPDESGAAPNAYWYLSALSHEFRENHGLKVYKNGDDFLYLYHPDTSEPVLEKWGGDILIQSEEGGFLLIFPLGLESERYIRAVKKVLEARSIVFSMVEP